jgi:hypothetical protein
MTGDEIRKQAFEELDYYHKEMKKAIDLKFEATRVKYAIDDQELWLVNTAGGMKALGSNDADRKLSKENMLKNDERYQSLLQDHHALDYQAAQAQVEADYMKYRTRILIAALNSHDESS